MSERIALGLVIHNHQPVGNFGWVFEDVYRTAYEPMLGALERHPGVRLALHYSGPLLDWLRSDHPGFLERLAALAGRGQVEIVGGAYYEPILIALPEHDRIGQLERMATELEQLFGRRPAGAWLAERVWEPSLPTALADAGYTWTVLDDNHLRAASVPEEQMWGSYTTDDQGRRLTVFGTEQGLRYRIPFGAVEDLIGYLRDHATRDGSRLGVMGDDGEKFGSWPGTFEHCWADGGWVERCFAALEANADWLRTLTPSQWLAEQPPIGRIYLPAASYVEMTEWALPATEAGVFHDLLRRAREAHRPEARFLRGGMWRNFQARYREINDLHKQMLRVSAKVAAMPDGPQRERALDHLFQGQSNDCYWHGLFGGVYIVHMRMATLAHLIAAEDLADRVGAPDGYGRLEDLDLDGVAEAILDAPGQIVTVDLGEGAGIGSWDLRASRLALASVMRRRPEAYHDTLREHGARRSADVTADTPPDAAGAPDAPSTIHDVVRVKEVGLAEHLHYDWHERRSGLVHLVSDRDGGPAAALGPDAWRGGAWHEQGDFVDRPFEVVSVASDELVARRAGGYWRDGMRVPLQVTKRLRLGGSRSVPELALEVAVATRGGGRVETELALEWGIDLLGGGGNPQAYYELPVVDGAPHRTAHDGSGDRPECAQLCFGNDAEGVAIEARAEPPARVTWYPIETISNSEAGFERTYQGSCLLFRWPLALDDGAAATFSVRFRAAQARDHAALEAAH